MAVHAGSRELRAGGLLIDTVRLRREMWSRGLDQRGLGRVAGLCEATISKLLTSGTCSVSTLAAVARGLEGSPELAFARELLGGETAAGIPPIPTAVTEETGDASAAPPNPA